MNAIRNRVVNFRVSEEEFQRLKDATAQQNSRCLSDFARMATLRVANGDGLETLDRRLANLELSVAMIVERVVS